MVDEVISKVLHELSQILKNKYSDFKGIYFFGSRVKGNNNEYSDYDIVIVFDRKIDWRFEDEITHIVYGFELKYDIFIDNKTFNYKDILNPITPFRENVKNEGLYYAC